MRIREEKNGLEFLYVEKYSCQNPRPCAAPSPCLLNLQIHKFWMPNLLVLESHLEMQVDEGEHKRLKILNQVVEDPQPIGVRVRWGGGRHSNGGGGPRILGLGTFWAKNLKEKFGLFGVSWEPPGSPMAGGGNSDLLQSRRGGQTQPQCTQGDRTAPNPCTCTDIDILMSNPDQGLCCPGHPARSQSSSSVNMRQ